MQTNEERKDVKSTFQSNLPPTFFFGEEGVCVCVCVCVCWGGGRGGYC